MIRAWNLKVFRNMVGFFFVFTAHSGAFSLLFRARVDYVIGDSAGPKAVRAADLDGDSWPDMIVANAWNDSVSVLLGYGDGTLSPPMGYGVGHNPASVSVADFDGDGVPDLAVANQGSDDISVLLGNGDGTFGPVVHYGVGPCPKSIAAADLIGDGPIDLATADVEGASVSVMLNLEHSGISEESSDGPRAAVPVLWHARPNPFTYATTIEFAAPARAEALQGRVSVCIFDASGRLV